MSAGEPTRCALAARHGRAWSTSIPKRIVLDIDDTFDAVHGNQQLRLFNALTTGTA